MDVGFLERQKELCLLSSFIQKQEEWLQEWISPLGWTVQSLQQEKDRETLVRCPFNAHHFVPCSSLGDHSKKCQFASALGTDIHKIDLEEFHELEADQSFVYQNSTAELTTIGKPIVEAARKLATNLPEIERVARLHENHAMHEQFSSLEETHPPSQFHFKDAAQKISFIKSWKRVPQDFAQIDGFSLNLAKIKGWLFKNLPDKHAHSTVLGGEITMVDTIMSCLAPSSKGNKRFSFSPNALVNRLQPLLGLNARALVLELIKFLHISQIQGERGMSDNLVADIAPMPQAMVQEMKVGGEEEEARLPSIAELIVDYVKQEDNSPADADPATPLPPRHMIHQLSTSERRILYDYVVEVTSQQALMKLDPDLYRDDMAVIQAKLKIQAKSEALSAGKDEKEEVDTKGKTYLQLLKEKRDYKRRRQKYRAKNVHITRRTPTEIFRTIINNRMEELRRSLGSEGKSEGLNESEGSEVGGDVATMRERSPSGEREHHHHCERKRRRSRSKERRDHKKSKKHKKSRSKERSRRRSRSSERETKRSRSQSRERRGRSRNGGGKRSRSRERVQRSRSRERSHKHKKHKKRSRSRS